MDASKKKLRALSDQNIKAVNQALDGFNRALEQIARDWRRRLVDMVAEEPPGRLFDLPEVAAQVRAQLNRGAYEANVRRLIAAYDDCIARARRAIKQLGLKTERLAPLDEKALAALRRADYSYLIGVGDTAVREVSQQVVLNAIAGRPRSAMIEAIQRVVDMKFKSHAATYADTALVSYDRRVNFDMFVEAGVTHFMYRGPRDIKNRPFCLARVGKVYSVEQIERMSNRQLDPPKYFGGGWNCRHVWSPARAGDEELKP